ncbi:MAG: DUF4412 domain-containing protein [Bacteroidota bacterium]
MAVQSLSFFFTTCCLLLSLGGMNVLPAQDSSPGSSYFEGSMSFEVRLKGANADMIKQNEPNTKLLMHLKEADYIVQLSGGRYPKTFLFVADSNVEYSMDMANKRAFRFSSFNDLTQEAKEAPAPTAEPTGKKEQVNGIWCEEYRMKTEKAIFLFYVSDEYRVNLARFPDRANTKASFLARGLDGRIPLKTIKRQSGLIAVTTLTKVMPREFDEEQFQIPPNFKVKKRDYRY